MARLPRGRQGGGLPGPVLGEQADAGLDVVLLESGQAGRDAGAQALSHAEISNPSSHAPMDLAVQRGFGGTSALWGGRAVPFDPQDFDRRAAAPEAVGAEALLVATPGAARPFLAKKEKKNGRSMP